MSTPIGCVTDIRAIKNAPEIEVALGKEGVIEVTVFRGDQTITDVRLGVVEASRLVDLLQVAIGEQGEVAR